MKKRNILSLLILVIMIFGAGCASKQTFTRSNNAFELNDAKNTVDQYMGCVMKNDIKGMKKYYTNELIQASEKVDTIILKPNGYFIKEWDETGNSALLKVMILKNLNGNPYGVLEEVSIKVIQEDKKYKIAEIKSNINKEVFLDKNSLKVRNKNEGKAQVLVSKKSIPNYAYSALDKACINKIEVPKDNFSQFGISFDGKKVAVTTLGDYLYICTMEIAPNTTNKSIKQTEDGEEETQSSALIDAIAVAQNIKSVDIIKGAKGKEVSFSPDGKFLILTYSKSKAQSTLNIYNIQKGEMVPFDFSDKYPIEKVQIKYKGFKEDNLLFEVKATVKDDETKECTGLWKMDMEKLTAKKIENI